MTRITTASAPQPAAEPRQNAVAGAAWYVGLTLAFAAVATVAVVGLGAEPTLLAFSLALPPLFIATVLAWHEGHGAIGRLFRQLTVRPANPRWYLALLIPPIGFLAVDVVAIAMGASTAGLFDDLFPAILIVPLVVILPAFAEEIGWRGYALPRTMTVMSPLRAAIVLGIPWSVIHIPLYLPGQMNGGSAVWSMLTQVVSYSIILTWLYVGTGGSVLMTGLFHTLLNGMVPLTNGLDPNVAWDIRGIVFPVVAAVILVLGGYRVLERRVDRAVPVPEVAPAAVG